MCLAMQALIRSAFAEIGKGVGTALIVRAGSQPCAVCPSCSLVCPEPARLPDCICQAGQRQVDPHCPAAPHWSAWLCVLLVGILIGVIAQWRLSRDTVVEGKPYVAAKEIQNIDPNTAERERIRCEAKEQIAAVKAKAKNGTGAR